MDENVDENVPVWTKNALSLSLLGFSCTVLYIPRGMPAVSSQFPLLLPNFLKQLEAHNPATATEVTLLRNSLECQFLKLTITTVHVMISLQMAMMRASTSVWGYSQLCNAIVFGLLLLFSIVCSSWAQFAIPERYDGFVYKGGVPEQEEKIVWEVFIDPLCVHCKKGWPAVIQVAERYGESLNVIVHLFPAPFHHNSFFASRALHIAQMTNASLVYPLLELIFGNQETFSNPNTQNETPAHVVSRLVSLASDLGISPNLFEDGFNNIATDQATRISFKYGCSRGLVGTPTYLINGVKVEEANDGWTGGDWAKIFDPMMKPKPVQYEIPLIAKLNVTRQ